jgi:hypothetical protein
VPILSTNFEEIILRAYWNFEYQSKVLEFPIIIINYCIIIIIIIDAYYNSVISAHYHHISNKGLLEYAIWKKKFGSNWGCYYFCLRSVYNILPNVTY